jgi:hypothetical protein
MAYRFPLRHLVELLGGDIGDAALLRHLVGGVVDQDVDPPKLADRGVDDARAGFLVPEIPRTADRPAAVASTRRTVSSASASSDSR